MFTHHRTKNFGARASLVFTFVAAGSLLLSGCSASGTTTAKPSATATSTAPATGGAPDSATQSGSNVSGTIAAISGSTLQVQDSSAQTAVTYSAATTITEIVAAKASAVTVGSCVSSMAGAPGSTTATAVTTIAISTAASDGTCAMGAGGGTNGGIPPTGAPGNRPSGAPGTPPNGAPTGAANGNGTPPTKPISGVVTAVTASKITVSATSQSGAKTSETIDITSGTLYTSTVAATASSLVVNKCVIGRGTAGGSGDIAATTLTVSTPGASGCSTGANGPGASDH